MKMSTSRHVVIVPDWHIYVSRCGVRKSCKEPLTITNYLKNLPFFFYVSILRIRTSLGLYQIPVRVPGYNPIQPHTRYPPFKMVHSSITETEFTPKSRIVAGGLHSVRFTHPET